jgi:hypothetical protein
MKSSLQKSIQLIFEYKNLCRTQLANQYRLQFMSLFTQFMPATLFIGKSSQHLCPVIIMFIGLPVRLAAN